MASEWKGALGGDTKYSSVPGEALEQDDDHGAVDAQDMVTSRELSLERMEIRSMSDRDEEEEEGGLLHWRWAGLILGVMTVSVIVVFTQSRHAPKPDSIVDFTCPAAMPHLPDMESLEHSYANATKALTTNITEFIETFRTSTYDDWGRTYEQVKEGMYHWKKTQFAPNLNNGDSIYESACGIGLNLYMTLEVLNEVQGIESLVVYGNEYVDVSTKKANTIFDHAPPFHAVKGKLCTADSAHLEFVPSNSFDLVYTGYVTPLYDPLDFKLGTNEENYGILWDLCTNVSDWKSQKLSEMAQKLQNDHYGIWIAEMVRIAKPGKPIIVEQVSMPYCEEYYDWGGVNQEWWEPAINEYRWDVDPDSIFMERDTIMKNRYHVFMRKKDAR